MRDKKYGKYLVEDEKQEEQEALEKIDETFDKESVKDVVEAKKPHVVDKNKEALIIDTAIDFTKMRFEVHLKEHQEIIPDLLAKECYGYAKKTIELILDMVKKDR